MVRLVGGSAVVAVALLAWAPAVAAHGAQAHLHGTPGAVRASGPAAGRNRLPVSASSTSGTTLLRLSEERQVLNGLHAAGMLPHAGGPAASGQPRLARTATGSHGDARMPSPERTGGHAVIPAAKGRPVKVPEPTYLFRGLRVPVGACGAFVAGHVEVLPCNAPAARAYRVRATRRAQEVRWAGDAGAGLLALAAGWLAVSGTRRRHRRVTR